MSQAVRRQSTEGLGKLICMQLARFSKATDRVIPERPCSGSGKKRRWFNLEILVASQNRTARGTH